MSKHANCILDNAIVLFPNEVDAFKSHNEGRPFSHAFLVDVATVHRDPKAYKATLSCTASGTESKVLVSGEGEQDSECEYKGSVIGALEQLLHATALKLEKLRSNP